MENIDELSNSNKEIGNDKNYNKSFTQPSTSKQYTEEEVYQAGHSNKVEDNIEGVQTALLKKGKLYKYYFIDLLAFKIIQKKYQNN